MKGADNIFFRLSINLFCLTCLSGYLRKDICKLLSDIVELGNNLGRINKEYVGTPAGQQLFLQPICLSEAALQKISFYRSLEVSFRDRDHYPIAFVHVPVQDAVA